MILAFLHTWKLIFVTANDSNLGIRDDCYEQTPSIRNLRLGTTQQSQIDTKDESLCL